MDAPQGRALAVVVRRCSVFVELPSAECLIRLALSAFSPRGAAQGDYLNLAVQRFFLFDRVRVGGTSSQCPRVSWVNVYAYKEDISNNNWNRIQVVASH
jgi:hypothetical protein